MDKYFYRTVQWHHAAFVKYDVRHMLDHNKAFFILDFYQTNLH